MAEADYLENPQYYKNPNRLDERDTVLDENWAISAFLIKDGQLTNQFDKQNRYWSRAELQFTDTRMGGNIGVNSRPQFTRYADIRAKGRVPGRTNVSLGATKGNHGMGRYYYEAIDQNAQTIYLRFGVPQFSSLMNFFSKAFDPNISSLARTGRTRSIFYNVSKIISTVAFVIAFPVLSLAVFAGRLINTYFTRPSSRFYTLKPTMHLYWSSVNTLLNTIAVNSGILPRVLMEQTSDQVVGNPYEIDAGFLDNLHELMPDVFNKNYGLDAHAIANRAQRMANKQFLADYENLNNGSSTDFVGYVKKQSQEKVSEPRGDHSLVNFIKKHTSMSYWTSDTDNGKLATSPKVDPETGEETNNPPDKAGFSEYFDAQFAQGAEFAVFKVDHTGSVSESFSNSVGDSDIASKFNSMSSSGKDMRFSFAGGNLGDGMIANTLETIGMAVNDVVTGTLSGLTLGISNILLGLTGAGYIDVPKQWDNSSVELPKSTYKTTLISPYGNPISRLQNIFLPLTMLMAGTLPLSTGKQSYTSPFICQLFDKGRCQVQLGIIDSLSITRGVSNLPFTRKGDVLAIEVSFSVTDLSSIMHMPISTGSLFGPDMTMDEDNILMDYMAVLAGQDIHSQFYAVPKAKLNLAKKIRSMDKLTSPAYWASLFHDSPTTSALGTLLTLGSGESSIITKD